MATPEKPKSPTFFAMLEDVKKATTQTIAGPVAHMKVVDQITGDPNTLAQLAALSGKPGFGRKDAEAMASIIAPDLASFATARKDEMTALGTGAYQKIADTLYGTLKKHVGEINADGRNFDDDALKAFADNIAKKSTATLLENKDLRPPSSFLVQSAYHEQDAVWGLIHENVTSNITESIRTQAANSILYTYNQNSTAGWVVKDKEVKEAAKQINNHVGKDTKEYRDAMYTLYKRAVELGHAPNEAQLKILGTMASKSVITDTLLVPAKNDADMAQSIQDAFRVNLQNITSNFNAAGTHIDDMNQYYFGHNKDMFADIVNGLGSAINGNPALREKLATARTALQATNSVIQHPPVDSPSPSHDTLLAMHGVTGGKEHTATPISAEAVTMAGSMATIISISRGK